MPSSTRRLPRFSSAAFLAPMAGVSDPALRLLCRELGAGLVVTEFTSIHSIVARGRELGARSLDITDFIQCSEAERPLSVQLFGSDLAALPEAARTVEPFFDIIDYNMGCPAPHITRQMAGGALLREPGLTRRIFRALVGSVSKPVTVKMRAGVTPGDRRLFLDIARIAEEEGIQMITLHPRTVSQGYSGEADWSLIRELKSASGLPVVGNGDVDSPEKAGSMMEETGCDYVMVGRAAMANPLIFEQINDYLRSGSYRAYSAAERARSFFGYLDRARRYEGIGLARIKARAMGFTRGCAGAAGLRARITAARSVGELERLMRGAGGAGA